MKTIITSPDAPAPIAPFSPAVRVGDFLHLSGQGGFEPTTGTLAGPTITEQTHQTIRNIEALVGAAGGTLDDVVSCLVHLVDLKDFAEFNKVYAEAFADPKPARTTVQADLVAGMVVEITEPFPT